MHDNEGDAPPGPKPLPPSQVDCGYCDGSGRVPNMAAGYCFCGRRAEFRQRMEVGGQDAWYCACGIAWPASTTPRKSPLTQEW